MSLWVNLCPAVCMWLCVNYPVYLVPVFWVWFCLVYSLLPGVSCLWVLPCPALMSSLNTIIWVYILVCVFLYPPSCVHRDRRPDRQQYAAPIHLVLFCSFFVKFLFVPEFLSVCPAAWKSPLVIPAIAHCKSAWEFGGIAASAASPLAASRHARRSRKISTAGGGSPKPAGGLPSSRDCRSPRRAVRGRSRHWPASDSMPAGPPLAQCPPARLWLNARRIALTQCPPDRRWLKPAGSPLTQARRPPLSLAPWIKSTCHGQECRVSVLLCLQEHFKTILSGPWRLVWGRRLFL